MKSVEVLAAVHGWSKRETVANAIEALVDLIERHEGTAARASSGDIGELFLELAHMMPAGLTDVKVEEARFADGRPGLIVGEEWIVASDANRELTVARRSDGRLGRIVHGRIEPVADPELEVAPAAALKLAQP